MDELQPTLSLRLLGRFQCSWREDSELPQPSKKARGVLAYLALARGRAVSREQLASLFWPGSGEAQARQSLRQSVSSLRKLFGEAGEGVIVGEGGELALHPTRVQIDVDEVARALESSDTSALRSAAKWVGGSLLQDHVFGEEETDDWLRDERVRVQALCHDLLFRCAAELLESGASEELVAVYWKVLVCSPANEEAHRGLMSAYAALGKRGEALAQYQACQDALARHLDARPSEATRALFESLRDAGGELAGASEPPAAVTSDRKPTLPLPDKPAIVVLAFDNLSADPSKEYLCDGISEDITTFLAQFSSLYVISRTTAFTFKGKGLSVPEIGRQLGVHYVLEGSVQLAGERIRVTAQLIKAEQGGHVWSHRYDGTMEDIFEYQDEVVRGIVATTAGRIEASALERARRKASADLDAYDCVLRGKYHHHRCTAEDSERAVELFRKAIDRKPDYALARGWLVCALGRASGFGQERASWMNSESYGALMREGHDIIREGEAVDDEESECLRLLGEVHLYWRNYDEAERYLRRAYAFNPNDDRILSQMAAFLTYREEWEEAARFARQAIRLNPYHPGFYRLNLGRPLMCLGRYEEAVEQLVQATPPRNLYRVYTAACYAALDREVEAAQVVRTILEEEPQFSIEYFKVTMLFKNPDTIQRLTGLMAKAGLPQGSASSSE